jgi:predicted nucleic acid-binding protein
MSGREMILVDTSVLIDFFKDNKNQSVFCFNDVLEKQIPFGITAIVYQEILQGAKTQKEYNLLKEYLCCQRFFNPKDPISTYEKAALIYFSCRKKGITVRSTIDCLIAQIAIEHDLFLLQNDKDFEHMAPHIKLKLYPVTSG